MSNSFFRFKQFTIHQDLCAMKVGTDGILLGAWAPVNGVRRVLDVGCGTGLLSLMIAQRQPEACIDALDIDDGAAVQARKNISETQFCERINVIKGDVLGDLELSVYDLVVCNPPFFQDSLKCPDVSRTLARHNDTMPFDQLCRKVAGMLTEKGIFCVVIPADMYEYFVEMAAASSLYLLHCTRVCTKVGKPAKRVLLCFGLESGIEPVTDVLDMMDAEGCYTSEYRSLTEDFYLNLK